MKLVYPAIFYPCEEREGYTVEVPDLPGCVTEGDDIADAINMSIDAASGWILDELEDGHTPPKASNPKDLEIEDDGIVSLIVLDIDGYAEKYGKNAVRKNVTIPAYLNTAAEKKGLSLSKVLQEALTETVGL